MKTRSLRRPLAAVALAIAVVLASGAPARAAGTTSARVARSRAPHAAPVPTFQQWVNRLLAAIGLPPVTSPNGTGAGIATTTPQTPPNDNGAGIDPNG